MEEKQMETKQEEEKKTKNELVWYLLVVISICFISYGAYSFIQTYRYEKPNRYTVYDKWTGRVYYVKDVNKKE